MHAQLMRSTRARLELHQGQLGAAREHAPRRLRGKAERVRLHPPAARGVEPSEREIDLARVLFGRAFDDGPIGLLDTPALE